MSQLTFISTHNCAKLFKTKVPAIRELLRKGLINYVREAYDEYYSTGQDPTGGEIGPELDPAMLEEYEEDQAILDDDSAPFMGGIRRLEQLVDQLEVQVDELITRH